MAVLTLDKVSKSFGEFLIRVKTKGFIIITAIGPFLMALLMLTPMLLATRGAVRQRNLVME